MTPRFRAAILATLVAAAASGCGQTGPLELPESARPIERVDPPAAPEQTDDEDQDER